MEEVINVMKRLHRTRQVRDVATKSANNYHTSRKRRLMWGFDWAARRMWRRSESK
jgi:hypothetical protein